MSHSILPPSGSHAWRHCAAWPTMNRDFPQDDTPETEEGRAAHEVAWTLWRGEALPEYATPEMRDGAELIVATMREKFAGASSVVVERPVMIRAVHEACFGTPDAWAFFPDQMRLVIVDYKFGHRFVDEFENPQGVCYATGIIDELAERLGMAVGQFDQILRVEFVIVQPRCYYKGAPVRSWSFVASDLRAIVNRLHAAAEASFEPHPRAVVNPECCHCPGRHACPELQRVGYEAASLGARIDPLALPLPAASLELKMLTAAKAALDSRIAGLSDHITAKIKVGERAPWQKLEQRPGRRDWSVTAGQIAAMGDLMGVNLRKDAVISPAQAEKAGIDGSVILAYSERKPGPLTLVEDNPADARRVFGSI